jgi:hypothetical protein
MRRDLRGDMGRIVAQRLPFGLKRIDPGTREFENGTVPLWVPRNQREPADLVEQTGGEGSLQLIGGTSVDETDRLGQQRDDELPGPVVLEVQVGAVQVFELGAGERRRHDLFCRIDTNTIERDRGGPDRAGRSAERGVGGA